MTQFDDPEKPFHLPECECDDCESWRDRNYPRLHGVENVRNMVVAPGFRFIGTMKQLRRFAECAI